MDSVVTFLKVSKQQYAMDALGIDAEAADKIAETQWLDDQYRAVQLPARATTGSAGYDFYLPGDVHVSDTPVIVWTGVRCRIEPGWMLVLVPRSGFGTKFGLRLRNTVGIVDSDYFKAKNEGHIAACLTSEAPVDLKAGERFMQGILVPYGITTNDYVLMNRRVGGYGSTGQ